METIRSLIAAMSLAAAISSGQGLPDTSVSGACALVSRSEVEKAIASPVGEGEARLRIRNLTSCRFTGERGGEVAILVRRAPADDWVSEQTRRMHRGAQLGTYRHVSEFGDRSFLYDMRGRGGVLCVFAAGYYLQISLIHMPGERPTSVVLGELANAALARLQPTAAIVASSPAPPRVRPNR